MFKNTPLEGHPQVGLIVKREDMVAQSPAPQTGKLRGVFEYVKALPPVSFVACVDEGDGSGAVLAWVCRALGGVPCVVYHAEGQEPAGVRDLGATLAPLSHHTAAGRYGQASTSILGGAALMPRGLVTGETCQAVAAEVVKTWEMCDRFGYKQLSTQPWIVAAGSGMTARGVALGLTMVRASPPPLIVVACKDQDPQRLLHEVQSGVPHHDIKVVFPPKARHGELVPPFPCHDDYGRKAIRWWLEEGRPLYYTATFWNIG